MIDLKLLPKEVLAVREACAKLHRETGCKYDGGDYVVHLDLVAEVALRFIHLYFSKIDQVEILKAIYAHDALEDCGISPNDLIGIVGSSLPNKLYGKGLAATIVYCVTDELGWNRNDRADKTYPKIVQLKQAVFVKLCDRIANVTYSKESAKVGKRTSMYVKYCKEFDKFKSILFTEFHFVEMWKELALVSDALVIIKKPNFFMKTLVKMGWK